MRAAAGGWESRWAASFRGVGDLLEAAGRDVVDVPVDWNARGHERVVADPADVLDNALLAVRNAEPVDVASFTGAWSGADVVEPILPRSSAVSRLCSSSPAITSFEKNSIPQSEWWITNHSAVPSSL